MNFEWDSDATTWQEAMLEEYGLRRRRVRPLLADGAAPPSTPAQPAKAPPPAAPIQRPMLTGPRDHGGPILPARPGPGRTTSGLNRPMTPVGAPMSVEAYLTRLHRRLDGPKRQFVEAIAQDPVVHEAIRRWRLRQGWVGQNGPLFCEVFKRVSHALGEAYGFTPAWLGESPHPLPNTLIAYYDGEQDLVFLTPGVLSAPLPLLIAVITHEQVHAFQVAAIQRTGLRAPLDPELAALARYWDFEFARSAAGADYSTLGTEYHAFDVEQDVLDRLMALSNRWRPDSVGSLREFSTGLKGLNRLPRPTER